MNRVPLHCLLVPFLLLPAHASSAADGVVAFSTSARVDVDASGRPVRVEAPADLPSPIREFIEKRASSWEYSPAMHDGIAQAGTTFVWLGACAIPEGDGYRLAIDFKGNGPRVADGKPLARPGYPVEALRRHVSGAFDVVVAIAGDGTTTLESITPRQEGGRWNNAFRPSLEYWAKRLRFDPEQVAGLPVTSRIPVTFTVDGPSRAERAQRKEEARSTNECRLATGAAGDLQPIALDSPIKVTPSS